MKTTKATPNIRSRSFIHVTIARASGSGELGSPRAWPAPSYTCMCVYVGPFVPVCACTRLYADDSVAERARLVGARRGEKAHRRSKQQRPGSAGPALGPTGGPGVTFQDGCA